MAHRLCTGLAARIARDRVPLAGLDDAADMFLADLDRWTETGASADHVAADLAKNALLTTMWRLALRD